MKYNSLSGGYVYSIIGNFSNSFAQWVLLSLIAKFFGTMELGEYSLAMAWILPLYAFFSLQLRNIYVSDQERSYNFKEFFLLRLYCASIFVVVIFVLSFIFYIQYFYVFMILAVTKFFELMIDIIHSELHKNGEISVFSRSVFFRSVICLVLALLFFFLFDKFEIALLALPLSYFFSFLSDCKKIDLFNLLKSNNSFLYSNKSIFMTTIFTSISILIVYLTPNFPRIVLEKFDSQKALGLFSGYMSILVIMRVFVQSIIQNSLPKLSKYVLVKDFIKFKQLVVKEIYLVLILAILQFSIIPFSDRLFVFIYNDDFIVDKVFLSIIFTGALFSYLCIILNNIINSFQGFKFQMYVNIISFIICVALAIYLIPTFGFNGAAICFAATSFFQMVVLGYCSYSIYTKANAYGDKSY